MERAASVEAFLREPLGKWIVAGTTLGWCHSPTLVGTVCWGRPDEGMARAAMCIYDAYPQLAPRFDVIIDGAALESITPDALHTTVSWMRAHEAELRQRVRHQVGVMPAGLDGLALAGIATVLGNPYPLNVVTNPADAFRQLLPLEGDALHLEVATLVANVRAVPLVILELRSLLRASPRRFTVDEAARALNVATRSLQRELGAAATSFRDELLDARFETIERLLISTDDKVESIAARVGITKSALAALVRARAGRSPSEYRDLLRSRPRE